MSEHRSNIGALRGSKSPDTEPTLGELEDNDSCVCTPFSDETCRPIGCCLIGSQLVRSDGHLIEVGRVLSVCVSVFFFLRKSSRDLNCVVAMCLCAKRFAQFR